jgi:hypothetical protein
LHPRACPGKWQKPLLAKLIATDHSQSVNAPKTVKLSQHLGHKVTVTGTLRAESAGITLFRGLVFALVVNLPHDALRPLNGSNDHAPSSRAISRVEEILCCLQVTSN